MSHSPAILALAAFLFLSCGGGGGGDASPGATNVTANVAFSNPTGDTAEEADADAVIELTLSLQGASELPAEVQVTFAAVGGTATLGMDFEVPDPVTFPAGSADGETVTAALPVYDDEFFDNGPAGETVVLEIATVDVTGGDGGSLTLGTSGPATHEVTITDLEQRTLRASLDHMGQQIGSFGQHRSMSANGRFVAFERDGGDVVPGDTNNQRDAFVRDLRDGKTIRVSIGNQGQQGDGWSNSPWVSYDGRFVTFTSSATNLLPGDVNGARDAFLRDMEDGTTICLSVSPAGVPGIGGSSSAGPVTPDGRYALFASNATDLVSGDTNGSQDVFVRDLQTGVTERVSVATGGTEANGGSWNGDISPDGRYVLFNSDADNLVTGDTNGTTDVFLHDRQTGETRRINVDSQGNESDGYSEVWAEAFSADGRLVVYHSQATNLVAGDGNGVADAFLYDMQNGTTERISLGPGGVEGNGASDYPTISPDGRFVAYGSAATNLVPGDTNGERDGFLLDRQTGMLIRTSVSAAGEEGNSWSYPLAVTEDGERVAMESEASNLVAGDTNGRWDLFVHAPDWGASVQALAGSDDGDETRPDVSGDGLAVSVLRRGELGRAWIGGVEEGETAMLWASASGSSVDATRPRSDAPGLDLLEPWTLLATAGSDADGVAALTFPVGARYPQMIYLQGTVAAPGETPRKTSTVSRLILD